VRNKSQPELVCLFLLNLVCPKTNPIRTIKISIEVRPDEPALDAMYAQEGRLRFRRSGCSSQGAACLVSVRSKKISSSSNSLQPASAVSDMA